MNTKTRHFVPSKRFVGQTTVPTTVKHYQWVKGKGVWCVYTDGVKTKSMYKLKDLLSKEDLSGLRLVEIDRSEQK